MSEIPTLLESAPIGLIRVKRDRSDLTIMDNNQAAKAMFGPSLSGCKLDYVLASKEGQELCRRLKSPNPPQNAVLPLDSDQWGLVQIDATPDDYALYITNISSLKKEIEQADSAAGQKANFLATMSHEMRTPMQSVFGLLEMIEMEKPKHDILSMVRTAKNSASSLLEILDGVLDFAKMDAEQMELDLFEVPVRTLCRGIIEALEVKVQGRDVTIKDKVEEDVPPVIVGDPKRLRQIFINLVGNALKFTKEGSVTIHVTRAIQHIPAPERGLALRFEIIDTGIGMSEAVAARLFKPFSQADNSTARKYGGTGLGLSICKKLVEMMGGQIGVESKKGKGSTFWFEIPTEEVDVNAKAMDLPDLEGISILSVEDHPQGAKEIQNSLKSMGAVVDHCTTIEDARELMKRRPFDVAIIDQGLPDGLGIDLVREAMTIRPFMGIIMYTARDDAGLQHTLQSLGAEYLTKPAGRMGLGEAVSDAAAKIRKMTPGKGPRRLLIAEDTESVRDVLSRQLAKLGVDASFAENGEQALEAIRSGQYGILITDLHMPGMDGYELTKRLRRDGEKAGRHFPIIALTADVQIAQRQVYMEHGFDECLLKPVSLGHFRRLLIRWGLLSDAPAAAQQHQPAKIRKLSAIDKDAIIQQMGTFDDHVIQMLKLFPGMTGPLLQTIHEAQARKDFVAIKEAAHSLKGAAFSAGATQLGKHAARLQDEAEASSKDCKDLIAQTQKAFDAVKAEIETL